MSESLDVMVVGAGISGLTAAYELSHKSPQLKIAILEANDRIGGRILSVPLKAKSGNDRWDVGAGWVGKAQTHVIKLLEELEVGIFPQYRQGKNRSFYDANAGVISHDPDEVLGSKMSAMDLWNVLRKLQNTAVKVSPNKPFEDKNANKWNEMTLKQFVADNTWTQDARDQFEMVCETMMSCSSDQVSLLFFLMFVNSGGSDMDKMTSDHGEGAQGFPSAKPSSPDSPTPPNSISPPPSSRSSKKRIT